MTFVFSSEEEIVADDITGGQKGIKLERYDLIPVRPLVYLARVFGRGAKKYAERNWEKGYLWSKTFAALMRHCWAFWGGETIDPETGLPHMAHAAWHCFVLMEYTERYPKLDDRVPVEVADGLDSKYPGIGGEHSNWSEG
jgi:hypothetical protein